MEDIIQVLHIDDKPDFTELTKQFLEKENENIQVTTENSAKDGLEKLKQKNIDCIISDYKMSNTDGLEFLKRVRENHPNLPFILFTGKGSEEIASKAISAGATDYLQKQGSSDQYTILANRIKNAVDTYHSKKELKEKNRELETLISNLPGIIYRCENTPEWPMKRIKGKIEEVVGYIPEKIRNNEILYGEDIIHPEDKDKVWKEVQEAISEKNSFEITYRIKTKNNNIKWVWERGQGIYENGDLKDIEGFITDITKLRRHKENVEYQRSVLESVIGTVDSGVLVVDKNREFFTYNQQFVEMWDIPDEIVEAEDDEKALQSVVNKVEDPEEFLEKVEYFYDNPKETGHDLIYLSDGRIFERYTAPAKTEDTYYGRVWTFKDITERKKHEKELRFFKEIVDNAGTGIVVINRDGRFEYVNKAYADIFDTEKQKIEGMDVWDVNPEFKKELFEDYWNSYNQGEVKKRDAINEINDRKVPVEIITTREKIQGEPYNFGTVSDITERRKREKELREERALTKSIFRSIPDLVFAFDTDGNFLRIAESNIEVTGYTREEHEDLSPRDFFEGEDRKKITKAIYRSLNSGEPQKIEADLVTKDGEKIPYEFSASRIEDENGEILGIAGIGHDITEHKEYEEELERYERIIETSGDPVYTLDKNGCFTFVNEAYEELSGYSREELIGEHVSIYMDESDIKKGKRKIKELLESEEGTGTIEMDIITKDGERKHTEAHIAILPFKEEFRGTIGIIRDITERRKRKNKLKRQKRDLERKNRHLEDFAGLISHELRNPLNIAQMNLDFLEDKKPVQKTKNSLDRIEEIIDRLLMYTKMGKSIEETHTVELDRMARNCWNTTISTDSCSLLIEDEIEFEVDPKMVRHLLENLFRNAIEHGEASTIKIGKIENGFYIEDNGTGIPEDKRKKIFTVGYSDKGDTGLGLALVEQIVIGHNWNISLVESSTGGARFEITNIQPK